MRDTIVQTKGNKVLLITIADQFVFFFHIMPPSILGDFLLTFSEAQGPLICRRPVLLIVISVGTNLCLKDGGP